MSERFQTPAKATMLNLVFGVIFLFVTVFTTIFGTYLNAVATYSIVWFLGSLIAVVLPYRKKKLAQFMPAAEWRIPFVSIVVVISALFMAVSSYFAATTPAVGPSTPGRRSIDWHIPNGLVYIGAYFYRKSRGIDPHLVYHEVPPE